MQTEKNNTTVNEYTDDNPEYYSDFEADEKEDNFAPFDDQIETEPDDDEPDND